MGNNINHEYITNYLSSLIPESEGLIKELKKYAEEKFVPIITDDVASLLAILIRSTKALRILEIGTAIGYSAIIMAQAAGSQVLIDSIEINLEKAELAKENIEKATLSNNINIYIGDAVEVLNTLNNTYDLIFIDAAKGHYMDFFEICQNKLVKSGLIVCDNVLFRGMVAERSLLIRRKITIVKRLKKFLNNISNDKNFRTVILPLGDGVSISCKL